MSWLSGFSVCVSSEVEEGCDSRRELESSESSTLNVLCVVCYIYKVLTLFQPIILIKEFTTGGSPLFSERGTRVGQMQFGAIVVFYLIRVKIVLCLKVHDS